MDKFKSLLDVADDQDKTELTLLHNAVIRNMRAYQENSTAAALRDWEAAKTRKERMIEELWQKYFGVTKGYAGPLEVLRALEADGYKISKSTLYRDIKAGKLRREADGQILDIAVQAYVARLERVDGGGETVGADQQRKLQEEIKSLQLRNRAAEHDLQVKQGKFFPKADFEMELAGRAAVLDAGLKHFFQTGAAEIITLVGGDRSKIPDLIEMLTAALDQLMSAYADVERFTVTFVGEDQPEDSDAADEESGESAA
jgi:hypothetical protein